MRLLSIILLVLLDLSLCNRRLSNLIRLWGHFFRDPLLDGAVLEWFFYLLLSWWFWVISSLVGCRHDIRARANSKLFHTLRQRLNILQIFTRFFGFLGQFFLLWDLDFFFDFNSCIMQFFLLAVDWISISFRWVLILYGMIMVTKRHLLLLKMSIKIFSLESSVHFFKIILDEYLLLHTELIEKWAWSPLFLILLLIHSVVDNCRILFLVNRLGFFLNEKWFDIFQVFIDPWVLLQNFGLHLDTLNTRFLIQYLYLFLGLLLF